MKIIEQSRVDAFDYSRHEFDSRRLGSKSTLGILRPFGSDGKPIETRETLYFLHGGDGDDRQFLQAQLPRLVDGRLLELFRNRGIQIALPSIGMSFLQKNEIHPDRSMHDFFFEEVVPAVETGSSIGDSGRWLFGISMGGAGALQAFFRDPRRFAGVAAHFPGLIATDPFDPVAMERYRARTSVTEEKLKILISCFELGFGNPEAFFANDPFRLLESMDVAWLRGKRIAFDVGAQDDFGLWEGAAELSARLTRRGVPHGFVKTEGQHDLPFIHSRFVPLLTELLGI